MRRRSPVPQTAGRRGITVLLATCLTTLGLLATGMSAAQAHDQLVGSSPEGNATLDGPPERIALQFSGNIQELGTEVVVTGDDGTTVSDGAAQVDGTSVVQPLTAGLAPGTYTVQWRATSADGHPLSDEYAFTVTGGTTAAPSQSATDVGEASAASPVGSSSSAGWIVGGALLVLLAGAGLAVRQLSRRS